MEELHLDAVLSIQYKAGQIVLKYPQDRTIELKISPIEFLQRLLPSQLLSLFQKVLSQEFEFTWENTHFQLIFNSPITVIVRELVIKGDSFLQKISSFLANGTRIEIPKEITGRLDFSNFTAEFEKLTFKIKSGFFSKALDLNKISYDPKTNRLNVEAKFFGNQQFEIDLNETLIEKIDLEIQ